MIRVLLVDDHALFRSSLRVRLDREDGITTIGEAGTAEQAIAKARALQPDVVLLDLLLPRKDSYAAIPELLKASPSAKVLVVSSQTQPTSVRQAIGAGARGFVPKRSSDTELIEVGKRLYVSVRTVDSHRATIMRKRYASLITAVRPFRGRLSPPTPGAERARTTADVTTHLSRRSRARTGRVRRASRARACA